MQEIVVSTIRKGSIDLEIPVVVLGDREDGFFVFTFSFLFFRLSCYSITLITTK